MSPKFLIIAAAVSAYAPVMPAVKRAPVQTPVASRVESVLGISFDGHFVLGAGALDAEAKGVWHEHEGISHYHAFAGAAGDHAHAGTWHEHEGVWHSH
mmetsp:Transcript_27780/g.85896  ORF Transcript_27780/g.85896 Transcript_27780/m.85896 type:complete len:98 (+) Transcript_27780:537-830(+)